MSSNVRNILLRALFEPEFHNLLVSNPDEALKGYPLSRDEENALKNPGPDLYKYLNPSLDQRGWAGGTRLLRAGNVPLDVGGPPPPPPPPPPTTVTVIIVVAITVFVAAASGATTPRPAERFAPLIEAIRTSTGAERMDLVKTLVNELTRES